LKELDDYLNQKIDKFSGCLKDACNSLIEPVYTKDGFIYANECYLKKAQKEVKCYINKNCGL
jgi:4-aminobutyrate aminotransferase-like enzyme